MQMEGNFIVFFFCVLSVYPIEKYIHTYMHEKIQKHNKVPFLSAKRRREDGAGVLSGASLLAEGPTVDASRDAALPEEQLVLCQGPGLVAQQVAHLTQLLVQGGVPGAGRAVLLLPAHLHVPVDEHTVQHMDHIEPGDGKQPQ